MRTDLFFIPDRVGPLPVFGLGWLLIIWVLVSLVILAVMARKDGWSSSCAQLLPFVVVVGVLVTLVFPRLQIAEHGLPIRGYGLMLMVAVVSGVSLAAYRARQVGLNPELIYSLAVWMFLAGIAGARLFYVIQYLDRIETAADIFKFTEGGLVVYGSFFGAAVAFIVFNRKRNLPLEGMADMIAPSLMLGLAIGRIGCLLNGCCYGGLCEGPLPIRFPMYSSPRLHLLSPPYQHQLSRGQIHGVTMSVDEDSKQLFVRQIESGSDAEDSGLPVGAIIKSINGDSVSNMSGATRAIVGAFEARSPLIRIQTEDGQEFKWSIKTFPAHSRPVHPTQIYSAINAGLLCMFLWFLYPLRKRDGVVTACMLTAYPVGRFLLETIRKDEPGMFGTHFTISQWVSMTMLALISCYWIYLLRRPVAASASK